MTQAKVMLFTSPTCPQCPAAKDFIHEFRKERDDFQLVEYSTHSHDGQKRARTYNVMSVPTFIIQGPGYPQAIGLVGVQSAKAMNKYLDMSYGKVQEERPKQGIKERLKKGFKLGKFRFKL